MDDDHMGRQRSRGLFAALSGAGGGAGGDLLAGATLAAIAIPEQMATARLGDFPPSAGFLAFIAGALAFAAFGASRRLSVGADSTITPIFAGALGLLAAAGSAHLVALASMLALLAGILLILAGVFRLGWVADLLSIPVTTGFLAGVAIHIAVGQAPPLLGLPPGEGDIFRRLAALSRDIGETNAPTVAIGAGTLAFIVLCERISPKIPAPLLALVVAALATQQLHLEAHGVETLGVVAEIRPVLSIPHVSLEDLRQLPGLAFVVAVVAVMQTAATTRSFPDDPRRPPDVDRDFVGLGAANALSALLGAFPVNASPPRTAIVAETGGRSQMTSLWAALAVLGVGLYGGAAAGGGSRGGAGRRVAVRRGADLPASRHGADRRRDKDRIRAHGDDAAGGRGAAGADRRRPRHHAVADPWRLDDDARAADRIRASCRAKPSGGRPIRRCRARKSPACWWRAFRRRCRSSTPGNLRRI